MSRKLAYQWAIPIQESIPGLGVVREIGNGAPPTTAGIYAPGAIYQRLNGAAATTFYTMVGSTASPSWQAQGAGVTLATLTVTTLTSTTANITTLNPTNIVRASQTFQCGRGGAAKVGTSAGWVVSAGNNIGTIATMAASQSGGTLVVALPNLHVGDTITGFSVYSSINSAGGTVTLDANLRTLTIAAGATATDASVASITQVSVTAATASTATKSGLSTVVTAGVNYYLLLTGTTAGSTTIELDQIEVTVTTA